MHSPCNDITLVTGDQYCSEVNKFFKKMWRYIKDLVHVLNIDNDWVIVWRLLTTFCNNVL